MGRLYRRNNVTDREPCAHSTRAAGAGATDERVGRLQPSAPDCPAHEAEESVAQWRTIVSSGSAAAASPASEKLKQRPCASAGRIRRSSKPSASTGVSPRGALPSSPESGSGSTAWTSRRSTECSSRRDDAARCVTRRTPARTRAATPSLTRRRPAPAGAPSRSSSAGRSITYTVRAACAASCASRATPRSGCSVTDLARASTRSLSTRSGTSLPVRS